MAKLIGSVLGIVMLIAAGPSHAILIEAVPAAQSVDLGDQTAVDINVSGLGAGTAPSLAAFDIGIGFDPDILALDSVIFGDGLTLSTFGSIPFVLEGAGAVTLREASFALPVFLETLQPASFTLATLTFDTLAKGLSPVSFTASSLLLVTADGLVETSDVETSGGSVTVPEPSTVLLGLIGVIGLLFVTRRRKTPSVGTAI